MSVKSDILYKRRGRVAQQVRNRDSNKRRIEHQEELAYNFYLMVLLSVTSSGPNCIFVWMFESASCLWNGRRRVCGVVHVAVLRNTKKTNRRLEI